ncbi:aprataxin [Trichonephila clavipes]|nr:aprataxin [Trichonephila clavipes]
MKIKNNLQHKDEDNSLLKSIKSEILESLNKYESHPMSSNLQLSTLCDPRFRQNFTESPEEVKKLAVAKMRNIYTTQKISNPDNFENIETRTKEQNKKGLAKFFDLFGSNSNSENTRNPSQEAEKELNEYLSMPRVSFEHDPLDWWKVHYESFPSLKVLARKYLCIQGTREPPPLAPNRKKRQAKTKWRQANPTTVTRRDITTNNFRLMALKRENENSSNNAKKPKIGHWSQGLKASMEDPNLIVDSDDLIVIIKDKYPKAQHHYLILPKQNIPNLKSVSKDDLSLLKHMHEKAEELIAESNNKHKFQIGYHAVPSMSHLHLHVISKDFDSPCLKTKTHWNSFTSEYFISSKRKHQVARIVRHNDESIKEGYIRNGGEEVKLCTSTLKAFQCNNRIVMAQRKHLDEFLRGRIIGRLECGRTQLEVSEEFRIAQSVISRLWQRFQEDAYVSRCYSTGRPRLTTLNEDQYLVVTVKRNRRSTASNLSRQLSSTTVTTVSRQTMYRRLGHIGLYAHRPVRCVPLTATHCHLRLTRSREHALWTPQQWSCVMFSLTSPGLVCRLILAGL